MSHRCNTQNLNTSSNLNSRPSHIYHHKPGNRLFSIRMKTYSEPILKLLNQISSHDFYTVMRDFFLVSAISIRNAVDHGPEHAKFEKRYQDIIACYKKPELDIFAKAFGLMQGEYNRMLNGDRQYTDLCGELYMLSYTSSSKAGQFFTPYCASKLCADGCITEEAVKAKLGNDPDAVITIMEPSCGAGGMLIAAAERLAELKVNYSWNALAYATDIDERCVAMSYIQCSLLGIPAIITHGNALTLEVWGVWHTPAYIFGYLHFKNRTPSREKKQESLKKQGEIAGKSSPDNPKNVPENNTTTQRIPNTNHIPEQLSLF